MFYLVKSFLKAEKQVKKSLISAVKMIIFTRCTKNKIKTFF